MGLSKVPNMYAHSRLMGEWEAFILMRTLAVGLLAEKYACCLLVGRPYEN